MASVATPATFTTGASASAGSMSFTLRNAATTSAARRAFLAVVIGSGASVVLVSAHELIVGSIGWLWFVLVGLTVLSGSATLRLPRVPVGFSVSDSFTITAALLFGPAAGTVAVAIDGLAISFQLTKLGLPFQRVVFNAVAPALAMWLSAQSFFVMAGVGPLVAPTTSLGHLLGPLVIFAALYFVLNTGLIAAAIAFERRASILAIWRCHFLSLWLTYFGGASVAALLIALIYTRGADVVGLALIAPIPLILYVTFKNTVGRLEDQLAHAEQVNQMHLSTIETLAHAIDAKDQVTHGHIRRVQRSAVRLATALGIQDERQLRGIQAASLLHDMGKLALPEHILNKPGKLTAAEFERMKQHASIGADILSSIDFPYPVVPIVRHHHENWDGHGYPAGLKGDEIPIGARILAVVDCFDALTSDRPYRPKMSPPEAIAILRERSGIMYDPAVVATFLEIDPEQELESDPTPMALSAIVQTVQSHAARWSDDVPAPDVSLLAAMFDLGAAVSGGTGALADRLHTVLGRVMPATCTVVYVYDPATDGLIARHVAGLCTEAVRGLVIPLGQRLTGWVAAQRSKIVNSDAALDLGSLASRLDPPLRSCLSVALGLDDQLVGAITIYSDITEPFTPRHVVTAEVLAPHIALAIRIEAQGSN